MVIRPMLPSCGELANGGGLMRKGPRPGLPPAADRVSDCHDRYRPPNYDRTLHHAVPRMDRAQLDAYNNAAAVPERDAIVKSASTAWGSKPGAVTATRNTWL